MSLSSPKFPLTRTRFFDAELDVYTANGCTGAPKDHNRALRIEANVNIPGGRCAWCGKGVACNQACPAGQVLISQNTHIGGAPSGCKTGYSSSFCCTNMWANAVITCPQSKAGDTLAGSLNARFDSKVVARDLGKGLIDGQVGAIAECAAEAYRDGVLGSLAGLVLTVAGLYVLNHIPGSWIYSPLRGNYFQPSRLLPLPVRAALSCTTTVNQYVEETRVGGIKTTTCDGSRYP